MIIQSKQDVIRWLKRLKEDHPLSVGVCKKVRQSGSVSVYTDQVIRNRYQGMIEYLESDEVESCGGDGSDDVWCLDHRAYEDLNNCCQSAKEYDGK